jgi:hypothetical protein
MLAFLDKKDALASADFIGKKWNGKVYQVSLNGNLMVEIKSVENPGLTEELNEDLPKRSRDLPENLPDHCTEAIQCRSDMMKQEKQRASVEN